MRENMFLVPHYNLKPTSKPTNALIKIRSISKVKLFSISSRLLLIK